MRTGLAPGALLDELMGAGDVEQRPAAAARWPDGSRVRLPLERWHGDPDALELALLDRAAGPVLDIGCGPGRHVAELHRRGVEALGIDVLPQAVSRARSRGAIALRRSVFASVPDGGRWGTALLLDGNIGIGGDPVALLRRVRALLRPAGVVLVEVEPPGVGVCAFDVRIETAAGVSAACPWGRVGADGLDALTRAAGFRVVEAWSATGRWFGELRAERRKPQQG